MEMVIDFPGGARVDAHFGPYTVATDQEAQDGGSGVAASPFDIFLASIGTCAGFYVLAFCRQRGLATEGIRILESSLVDPETGLVGRVKLRVQLPPSFPEKYKEALVRTAGQCLVKKHLEHPPRVEITTSMP